MIKSVIAGAVAMAVVSFGANAADTVAPSQGSGQVNFKGLLLMPRVALKRSQQIRLLILARFRNCFWRMVEPPSRKILILSL